MFPGPLTDDPDAAWKNQNERCMDLPKKSGAGRLTCEFHGGDFKTALVTTKGGRYSGRRTWSITHHKVVIHMPRDWNLLPDSRVAFQGSRTEGECMILVFSRGYSMKWVKGYYFGGHSTTVKNWSPRNERKFIVSLVAQRLIGGGA